MRTILLSGGSRVTGTGSSLVAGGGGGGGSREAARWFDSTVSMCSFFYAHYVESVFTVTLDQSSDSGWLYT